MSDLTIQLLKLINEGKNLNEISETLHISHKKIFNYLTMIKNSGYDFKRSYYSNGDIIYTPELRYTIPPTNEVNLLMSQNDETLRAVVISDTHIGSEKERLDLLEDAYNYCVQKGIHIIFNCGDLLDNIANQGKTLSEDRVSYLLEKYPYEISGGQKQRVAVARALITHPKIILADEPTGALDSKSTDQLLSIFDQIHQSGQTILMVTHSSKAASYAGRVLFIKDGQIFHQLYKGDMSNQEMYQAISDTLTMLLSGGQ